MEVGRGKHRSVRRIGQPVKIKFSCGVQKVQRLLCQVAALAGFRAERRKRAAEREEERPAGNLSRRQTLRLHDQVIL